MCCDTRFGLSPILLANLFSGKHHRWGERVAESGDGSTCPLEPFQTSTAFSRERAAPEVSSALPALAGSPSPVPPMSCFLRFSLSGSPDFERPPLTPLFPRLPPWRPPGVAEWSRAVLGQPSAGAGERPLELSPLLSRMHPASSHPPLQAFAAGL